MKKAFLFTLFALAALTATAHAQTPVTKTPESAGQVDPFREADAKHNLDVASQYFRSKKAYKAVLMRFEETFAAYPEFTKMDEFLYLAGMSSLYLSENRGSQKIDSFANESEKKKWDPARLRENAVVYLTMLVERYPDSKFRKEAEKVLKSIKL